MDTPDPNLMEAYGTDIYYLEKSGELSGNLLALLKQPGVAPFLGSAAAYAAGAGSDDDPERDALYAQAEAMNQAARYWEAQRSAAVQAGFRGEPVSPQEAWATKMGQAMAKEAFIGGVMRSAGRGLGKMLSGGRVGKVVDWGGKAGAGRLRRGVGNTALKVEQAGTQLAKKNTPVTGFRASAKVTPNPAPNPAGYRGGPNPKPQPVVSNVQTQAVRQTKADQARGLSGQGTAAPAAAPAAAKPVQAAPQAAVGEVAEQAAKKPLLRTRDKLLLGGAGLIAAPTYLGGKAVGAVRDMALQPDQGPAVYGKYGPAPPAAVSPYGYAPPVY